MVLNWLDTRLARAGLAVAIVAITTLSLMPSSGSGRFGVG